MDKWYVESERSSIAMFGNDTQLTNSGANKLNGLDTVKTPMHLEPPVRTTLSEKRGFIDQI